MSIRDFFRKRKERPKMFVFGVPVRDVGKKLHAINRILEREGMIISYRPENVAVELVGGEYMATRAQIEIVFSREVEV